MGTGLSIYQKSTAKEKLAKVKVFKFQNNLMKSRRKYSLWKSFLKIMAGQSRIYSQKRGFLAAVILISLKKKWKVR